MIYSINTLFRQPQLILQKLADEIKNRNLNIDDIGIDINIVDIDDIQNETRIIGVENAENLSKAN